MIDYFFDVDFNIVALLGILGAFILTCFCLHTFMGKLPKDLGRDFAHNGKLSAGKPRGAGFIFILVFSVAVVLTGKLNTELIIYLILVIAAMMTGFLDDCSRAPWGELKKGLLDFVIAVMLAVTYLNFNSSDIYMVTINQTVHINPILFGVLAVILIWVSINVTNCADGVDGLSGTLTIVTLMSIYVINKMLYIDSSFSYFILLFVICILGYLWYNATPSVLMMGDAGSRAMGLFISIAILKTGCPLLYIPLAIVLILDGGLGLLKVSLLRFLKIHIMKNVRLPFHDHVRKVWNWSNTQCVFRFAIIQAVICIIIINLFIIRLGNVDFGMADTIMQYLK